MRVYWFCPESGVYQGEDFLEESHLQCTEGATCIAPPISTRGEVPVFDAAMQRWKLIKLSEKRPPPTMEQS